jgi:hypothetical protein
VTRPREWIAWPGGTLKKQANRMNNTSKNKTKKHYRIMPKGDKHFVTTAARKAALLEANRRFHILLKKRNLI